VGGVVGAVDRGLRDRVDPVVADDAVLVRIGAGQDGGMANRRHGNAVGLVRIGEHRAFVHQAAQAALAELAAVALQLLGRQAVDGQHQHQFRRGRGGRGVDGGHREDGKGQHASGKGGQGGHKVQAEKVDDRSS